MTGRIISVFKNLYRVLLEKEEFNASITGNMIKNHDFPIVGDYVEINKDNQIINILERKTVLSRKAPGKEVKEQPIVSNIDFVFIVTSLNKDFNISRLERYLTMVYDSGASPCFILTKADLDDDIHSKVSSLEDIAFGVPIHIVSSYDGSGLEELYTYLVKNNTIGLVGSSGVGKSTLINKILGKEIIATKKIREIDHKGKHTTTRREMFKVKDGYIIDTPGMRELQIWSGDMSHSFEDIEELALNCKFADCTHSSEPGCSINNAILVGDLKKERLINYKKLIKEQINLENKITHGHKFAEKEKIRNMAGNLNFRKTIKNRIK